MSTQTQTQPETVTYGEEAFLSTFRPVPVPGEVDEFLFSDFAQVGHFPAERVWTVMEHDDGRGADVLSGLHIVNTLGYVVTEVPWTSHPDAVVSGVWWAHEAPREDELEEMDPEEAAEVLADEQSRRPEDEISDHEVRFTYADGTTETKVLAPQNS